MFINGSYSVESLLLCAQQAMLSGKVTNSDVVNVLDLVLDLVAAQTPPFLVDESPSSAISTNANFPSGISSRIQLAHENLGLSEADLARQLNTYSDHISDWECGVTEPPASMIIPLANALKCDPLWLLTGEITPQASSDNVAQQHHRASQQVGGVSREALRQ